MSEAPHRRLWRILPWALLVAVGACGTQSKPGAGGVSDWFGQARLGMTEADFRETDVAHAASKTEWGYESSGSGRPDDPQRWFKFDAALLRMMHVEATESDTKPADCRASLDATVTALAARYGIFDVPPVENDQQDLLKIKGGESPGDLDRMTAAVIWPRYLAGKTLGDAWLQLAVHPDAGTSQCTLTVDYCSPIDERKINAVAQPSPIRMTPRWAPPAPCS